MEGDCGGVGYFGEVIEEALLAFEGVDIEGLGGVGCSWPGFIEEDGAALVRDGDVLEAEFLGESVVAGGFPEFECDIVEPVAEGGPEETGVLFEVLGEGDALGGFVGVPGFIIGVDFLEPAEPARAGDGFA